MRITKLEHLSSQYVYLFFLFCSGVFETRISFLILPVFILLFFQISETTTGTYLQIHLNQFFNKQTIHHCLVFE